MGEAKRRRKTGQQPKTKPLPTDTVMDRDDCDLPLEARDMMKAIYLTLPAIQELMKHFGTSPTKMIDTCELLRKAGALRIINLGDEKFQMQLHPDAGALFSERVSSKFRS